MGKLLTILVGVLVVAVAIGLVVLYNVDIPAPKAPVEKIIPDDKFPH